MVEIAFAASNAGRCGTTITEVTSRSRSVFAARNITWVSCSCRSPRELAGNSPLSV